MAAPAPGFCTDAARTRGYRLAENRGLWRCGYPGLLLERLRAAREPIYAAVLADHVVRHPTRTATDRLRLMQRCREDLGLHLDQLAAALELGDAEVFASYLRWLHDVRTSRGLAKSVNDTYGHAVGDKALVIFVEVMRANTRDGDLVGRLGGEEFCVLLAGDCLEDALAVAERIRAAFENTRVEGVEGRLTASFGVACRRAGQDREDLLQAADAALYRAKAGGRNRVVAADDPEP